VEIFVIVKISLRFIQPLKKSETMQNDKFSPYWYLKYSLMVKHDISEVVDIFTCEEKYATRVPDVASYEFYEWCIFQ